MDMKNMSLEEIIFQFMDQCKFLFYPEQWNKTFMDFSKNEVFALFLVYRKEQVNMTEIADYLGVPLNTATGIVSRLEKRNIILRERDKTDKRIVVVKMSADGRNFVKEQMKLLEHYFEMIIAKLSPEEMELTFRLFTDIFAILTSSTSQHKEGEDSTKKVKRIMIE